MRIQHNIMAMNAYRNYSNNTSALAKNLEKLSSGYKINRAGDDAAGLAISEKMRAQITGLKTAQKNAKDGISLIQTAEGALTEVHDMLNRMVELADQSANGTYDDGVDRANLQKEFDALRSEIDRISKATNFNGINLLDGSRKADSISIALGAALDKINGTTPNAATNAEITVKLDTPPAGEAAKPAGTTNGTKPTEASAAKVELTLGGVKDITVTGGTSVAATNHEYAAGALKQGAAGQNFDLEITYDDAAGTSHTETLSLTTGAADSNTFDAIKNAVAGNANLKNLFEVTGDASGVNFVSKDPGAAVKSQVTKIDLKNADATGVELGSAKGAVKDVMSFTVSKGGPVSDKTTKIGIGGTEYTLNSTGGDTATNIENASDIGNFLTQVAAKFNANPGNTSGYTAAYDSATGTFTLTANNPGQIGSGSAPATQVSIGDTTTITGWTAGTGVAGADAAADVTGTATAGKDAGYDIAGMGNGDEITINGTVFKKDTSIVGGAGTTGKEGDKITFKDVAGLRTELGNIGITATDVGGTGTLVTLKPTDGIATTGNSFGSTKQITTGTTKVSELAAYTLDGDAMSDLFTLKLNDEEVAWNADTVLQNGDKLELVAKTPGALSAAAMSALDNIAGLAEKTVAAGYGEGEGAAGDKTTYEMEFDLSKVADGQYFKIGDKTFEFTTDGTSNFKNPADATLINIKGFDRTDAAGQLKIAKAIQTAIGGVAAGLVGSGAGKFAIDGTPTAASIDSNGVYKLKLTANESADADTNQGQVRVSSFADGVIKGTYTPAAPTGANPKGTFATATYDNFDIAQLAEGDAITIGNTTITIVADADADISKGRLGVTDAKTAAKLINAFEVNGYEAGKINIDTANKKLTITDTEVGRTGTALANGAGRLSLAKAADLRVTADSDVNGLDITTDVTSYDDILKADLGGGVKVSDLFDVTVTDKNGAKTTLAAGDTTKFAAGDTISFKAKVAGQQTQAVMNAFKYNSGATVDLVNGTAEGQPGAGEKTEYDLTLDISKLADGQTFAIGNKEGKSVTFEISTDGTANAEGAVAIDIKGLDPTTAEGKEKIAKAVLDAVNSTSLAGDFNVKTGEITNGKFNLNIKAKEEGTATNLGQLRISQSSSGAISGSYSAASAGSDAKAGTFAKMSYAFDPDQLKVGDVLNIGGTKIEITEDDTSGDRISLSDAKDGEKLAAAFESNGFGKGLLEFKDGKLTVTGTLVGQTADDLATGLGKVSMSSDVRDMDALTGGLTLQIGDTSDSFNQLTVSIDSMNCAALGIDSETINIDTQTNAADAVSVLKNAINSVSGTRGDLGALQNRLEHTISNLSVMQENIQDAEASIRDVDVAQEMMEYTKNNILVQSAQAMLAQANQVPQGVLQLLQ